MVRFLHQLSAFFFYVLGLSFFGAYLLLRNGMWANGAAIWLQVADLPFAFSTILYGGTSLFLSLATPGRSAKLLGWLIGVPLGAMFIVLVVMNFWRG